MFLALQVQSGWARTHNVNLLAAGLIDPQIYIGGMGIYSTMNKTASVPISKTNNFFTAKVPKNRFASQQFPEIVSKQLFIKIKIRSNIFFFSQVTKEASMPPQACIHSLTI